MTPGNVGVLAPTQLVQDDQRVRCAALQDVRRLHELHEEGTLARKHTVGGTHACEDAIHWCQVATLRGYVASL